MINEKSAKGRKEIIVTSEKVTRPVKPWTTDVQRFLTYMTVLDKYLLSPSQWVSMIMEMKWCHF